MGVVVSAIATGLVHNIGADCVNNKDKIQDQAEDGVKVTKTKSGDSPHRIQTPGYPTNKGSFQKKNDETYGKFHILGGGGGGVSRGSFSICYNDTFKMHKKPF